MLYGIFILQLGNQVSFEELMQKALSNNATRCGSTNDPNRRKNEYSHEGYNGTMYFASTSDMKQDENTLLGIKKWLKNKQTRSNSQDTGGFVYVIVE